MKEEEILEIMNNLLPDTTPERIKMNRGGGEFPSGKTKKGSPIIGYKIKGMGFLDSADGDLADLLYEYKHYFDKGYQSPHSIEELPDLIRKRCEENIKGRIWRGVTDGQET